MPMSLSGDLATLPHELDPDELLGRLGERARAETIETGDPGTAFDRATAFDDLPPYAGPPEPAQPAPEWGAAAADTPDDVPLSGPALAPYGQAADPEGES